VKTIKAAIATAAILLIGVNLQAQIDDRLEGFDRDYVVSKSNPQHTALGLEGMDPVSFFQEDPQMGSEDITENFGGVVYRFSSEENRAEFLESPEKFEPTYGGYCAWAMRTGGRVPIDLNYFSFDLDEDGNKLRIHFFVAARAMENFHNRRAVRGLSSLEILDVMLQGDETSATVLETARGFQAQADDSWFDILDNDL